MVIPVKAIIHRNKAFFSLALETRNIFRRCFWLLPLFRKRYIPSITRISLEIMSGCNLSCFNCEAACRNAPTSEYMSVDQINKFVDESIDLNWRWECITLRGGEPTLHPQLLEIVNQIERYKKSMPACEIHITSNGCGRIVNDMLLKLPDWVIKDVGAKSKSTESCNFHSFNVAPVDLKSFRCADFSKACWRSQLCGMGLSRYGYYPCAPGASVDRVFGFDLGIKDLSKVDHRNFISQLGRLCSYCGHYKEPNESVLDEKISCAWREAFDLYKIKKTEMSLY